MKTRTMRDTALALTGLAALAVCILACTSFSPDDSKVLYPVFSGADGAVGMAVYDCASRKSDLVFVPTTLPTADTNAVEAEVVRPQWLDNRRILLSWPGGQNDPVFHLAVLSLGVRGPVRLFDLPGTKAEAMCLAPLPVAGESVFVAKGESRTVIRLDVSTGAFTIRDLPGEDSHYLLFPAAPGEGVLYLQEPGGQKPATTRVFGRMDPRTFALTPLISFTNEIADGSFLAFDPRGRRLAFLEGPEDSRQVCVLERGKPAMPRRLDGMGSDTQLGNAAFSRRGDTLIGDFHRKKDAVSSFGLIEIPLGDGPARETLLVPACQLNDEHSDGFLFQVGLSHDGKTAAVASTYVASASKQFKPEDCALFLVDLSDPNRKVTKVPIPMSPWRTSPAK